MSDTSSSDYNDAQQARLSTLTQDINAAIARLRVEDNHDHTHAEYLEDEFARDIREAEEVVHEGPQTPLNPKEQAWAGLPPLPGEDQVNGDLPMVVQAEHQWTLTIQLIAPFSLWHLTRK
jgi:hypothetical protein